MMTTAAELLWSPLLVLLYLGLGLALLVATDAMALRRSWDAIRAALGTLGRTSSAEPGRGLPHGEAFFAALAASVGVGNLAGVATALHLGGPGALFWMWVSALVGASFRMSSAYWAIRHRPRSRRSAASATPMAYLEVILPGSRWVAHLVAVLLIGVGFINANLIQSNSIAHALTESLGLPALAVSVLVAGAVAMVIFGGLQSIVTFAVKLTPAMLLLYVGMGLYILLSDVQGTGRSLAMVLRYAFHPYPMVGGVGGYLVLQALQLGISRGIFSHGAGIGIAPFFQARNDDHPARGALMAAAVPLVDTLFICTITGLVILSKGFWPMLTGAFLTVSAFESGAGLAGKAVVSLALILFAFTTMVSWAHFAERCARYLRIGSPKVLRTLFCAVAFIGPFFPVAFVWTLGDLLIGLLLIAHLIPLAWHTLRSRTELLDDLDDLDEVSEEPTAEPRSRSDDPPLVPLKPGSGTPDAR